MEVFNVASIVYLGIVIGLIVIFVVSFSLFIRRLLINTAKITLKMINNYKHP